MDHVHLCAQVEVLIVWIVIVGFLKRRFQIETSRSVRTLVILLLAAQCKTMSISLHQIKAR